MSTRHTAVATGPAPGLDPLYQQIRRSIRDGILAGTRSAGERLPSEAELARRFGTTRTTVRHALSALVFQGMVVRHNGRGSFVAAQPVVRSPIDSRHCLTFEEQVALTGRTVTYGTCSLSQGQATSAEAAALRVDQGSAVFLLERLRLIEGLPVCLEQRVLPPTIGLHVTGQMLATQSVHRFASAILGEPIPSIVVSITAETASVVIAAKLGVPAGAPLIVRHNTLHIEGGAAVLCGRSTFRGDVRTEYVLGQALQP